MRDMSVAQTKTRSFVADPFKISEERSEWATAVARQHVQAKPMLRGSGRSRILERRQIMKRITLPAILPLATLSLGGCGYNQGDRAVSGGLLGAGTGAVIGSLSGNAGAGAIIGGVGGAALGAFTDPNAVNLGRPIWR
jgi:osmotically inducible lipoprotein OsmB